MIDALSRLYIPPGAPLTQYWTRFSEGVKDFIRLSGFRKVKAELEGSPPPVGLLNDFLSKNLFRFAHKVAVFRERVEEVDSEIAIQWNHVWSLRNGTELVSSSILSSPVNCSANKGVISVEQKALERWNAEAISEALIRLLRPQFFATNAAINHGTGALYWFIN